MTTIDDVKNPVPAVNPKRGVSAPCVRGIPEGCSCPACVRQPAFCNEAAAYEMAPKAQFAYLLRRIHELEVKVGQSGSQSVAKFRKEIASATSQG